MSVRSCRSVSGGTRPGGRRPVGYATGARSVEPLAAVDVEGLAGDDPRPRRDEEHDAVRDLVLGRDDAQRDAAPRSRRARRRGDARASDSQPMNVSTFGPPIQPGATRSRARRSVRSSTRHRLRRGLHRGLRRRVAALEGRMLRMLIEMMNTTDASPCSSAAFFRWGRHAWVRPSAPHVDLEDLAPLDEVDRFERLERVHAERVVHQPVEPAELVDRAVDERLDLLGVDEVRRRRARPPSASISPWTWVRYSALRAASTTVAPPGRAPGRWPARGPVRLPTR